MKFSEAWLRELVNPTLSQQELAHVLTMGGLEVEEIIEDDNDHVIDLSITPNRGDCLSILGIARDVSALTATPLAMPQMQMIAPDTNTIFPVEVSAKKACPRYVGRVIENVDLSIPTPAWLSKRLTQCGIQAINPPVDVMNYVMLELGQPMHAFDLNTLQKGILVKLSKKGETIRLLNDRDVVLDNDTLIIADHEKTLAIAGVMGGMNSGVSENTTNLFLESAYFSPETIARQRQAYQLNSDSSYRFERGVDAHLQQRAIQRATQLILSISGGNAGPVIEIVDEALLPNITPITLRFADIKTLLGIEILQKDVEKYLTALGFTYQQNGAEYSVNVPSHRFDITISCDLIEEIARLYGYDHIPISELQGDLKAHADNLSGKDVSQSLIRETFLNRGFNEILTYSFIPKTLQTLLDPAQKPKALVNPITEDHAVMRTNLWPGLLQTAAYNLSRQQDRLRLFELGTCFVENHGKLEQIQTLAALIIGNALKTEWASSDRAVDFYDLKGDIETLFAEFAMSEDIRYVAANHPSLHPGQSATIFYKDKPIGQIGALHPSILQQFDFVTPVFLVELNLASFIHTTAQTIKEISKFPEIRRDIAILVNETVPAKEIQDTIKESAGDWLNEVFIFDIYHGKGVPAGFKSVAIALILKHPSRTLIEAEVLALMDKVLDALKVKLGAEQRR